MTGNHTVGEMGIISLQCSFAGGPHSMVVWLKRSEEEVKIVLNSSRVLVTHQRQTSGDVHVVTSNLTVHNVSTVDHQHSCTEVISCQALQHCDSLSPPGVLHVGQQTKFMLCS